MSRPSGLRGGSLVSSKNRDALTVLLQLASLLEEASSIGLHCGSSRKFYSRTDNRSSLDESRAAFQSR